MRFPGFEPRPRVVETTEGAVVVERRPGESVEAFEDRRSAHVREREAFLAGEKIRRDAYEEGRRDQHRIDRHAGRPGAGAIMLSGLVVIVAAAGVLWTALAVQNGSFASGGAVVDRAIARATGEAQVAANDAVDRTGAAVQNAGQAIEDQGAALRGRTQ